MCGSRSRRKVENKLVRHESKAERENQYGHYLHNIIFGAKNNQFLFSRGHAILHLAVSVGRSVRPSVRHIFDFRAVFALLLLPNRPRLDCRVSGLVHSKLA